MLDWVYSHEKPLPLDRRQIYRLVRATSRLERRSCDAVLHQFWVATPSGYINTRAFEEIDRIQPQIVANKQNAQKRWRTKRESGNANGNANGNAKGPNSHDIHHTPYTIKEETHTPNARATTHFDAFWNAYPEQYRGSYERALRSWNLEGGDAHAPEIMAGLQIWFNSDRWSRGIGIPEAENFLKKQRWHESPMPRNGNAPGHSEVHVGAGPQLTPEASERLRAKIAARDAAKKIQ